MNSGLPYGGDEIGSLVFDVGSYSFRAGYSQDDSPKFDIPAVVAVNDDESGISENNEQGPESNNITSKQKYYVDIPSICTPKKGLKLSNYMKDGMIDDWDLFEHMLDYVYGKCFQTDSKCHPVLMSECPANNGVKREKLMELMFEKYNVPAFFLVKNAVLAAFASCRVTGIVVDSGATHTSAVAIHDGYVLNHAIVKSPLAGDFITMQCKQFLQENNIEVIPPYMIANKESVKCREAASWTKKSNLPDVNPTWHNYMVKRVIQDFQHEVLQVSESPFDEKIISALPTLHYEFPNGYNLDIGTDRFKIPEVLFDPPPNLGSSMLGVSNLVTTSIGACEVDVRPMLYNNVMITGGNSCIEGFDNRLNRDLSLRAPSNMRLKTVAIPTKSRRFNAWIGGSILSSVTNFDPVWVSSQEYQENGKGQVHRRCP